MNTDNFKNIVESLIFASEEEITSKQIRDILVAFNIKVDTKSIDQSVDDLNEDYKRSLSSFEIIKIAGGYQFSSRKEYGVYVGKLFDEKQKKRLSQSSIETLAIVAYKQPITRSEIEFIRGVNVDYIINSLLERNLVTIAGRATTPGKPILYSTTPTFLKVIGLNSLEDLPKLKEINDILKNEKIEGITEADIDLFNSINVENIGDKSKGTANEQKQLSFDENGVPLTETETETKTEIDSENENESESDNSDNIAADEVNDIKTIEENEETIDMENDFKEFEVPQNNVEPDISSSIELDKDILDNHETKGSDAGD